MDKIYCKLEAVHSLLPSAGINRSVYLVCVPVWCHYVSGGIIMICFIGNNQHCILLWLAMIVIGDNAHGDHKIFHKIVIIILLFNCWLFYIPDGHLCSKFGFIWIRDYWSTYVWKGESNFLSSCKHIHNVVHRLLGLHNTLQCVLVEQKQHFFWMSLMAIKYLKQWGHVVFIERHKVW